MPFLNGPLAAKRFRLPTAEVGVTVAVNTDPAALTEALNDHAFNHDRAGRLKAGERVFGWVHGDGEETDFSSRTWLYSHYALIALRVDELKVPSGPVKREVTRRIKAWCESNERLKAPKSIKQEILEIVTDEYALRTLPKTQFHWVLWNTLDDGYILLHTFSTKAIDLFRTTFRHTFGASPDPLDAHTEISGFDPDLHQQVVSLADIEGLSRDFYLWLWRSTTENQIDDIDEAHMKGRVASESIEFRAEERMQLEKWDGTDAKTTLAGEQITKPEVRSGLRQQKGVVSLGLQVRYGDLEYNAGVAGGGLDIRSLKMPTHDSGADEIIYERVYLYERFIQAFHLIYETFLRHRLETTTWSTWQTELGEWLGEPHRGATWGGGQPDEQPEPPAE
jgi:hypothetical protein